MTERQLGGVPCRSQDSPATEDLEITRPSEPWEIVKSNMLGHCGESAMAQKEIHGTVAGHKWQNVRNFRDRTEEPAMPKYAEECSPAPTSEPSRGLNLKYECHSKKNTYTHTHTPTHPHTHAPTHPRTHAPTHPRTHAPTHPHTHAPTHPRTHAPTHPHTHTPTHPHTHTPTHPHTHTHTDTRTHGHTHTHTRTHTHTDTHTHGHTHTDTHTRTHTHTHTDTHTHTRTHTHTHTDTHTHTHGDTHTDTHWQMVEIGSANVSRSNFEPRKPCPRWTADLHYLHKAVTSGDLVRKQHRSESTAAEPNAHSCGVSNLCMIA